MRNIQVKDYIGALLAGIIVASLVMFVASPKAGLLVISVGAIALALYDYRNQKEVVTEKKGGNEKWW